jgi:hypothetical protein
MNLSESDVAYAGPSGRAVWGEGLDRLDTETVGSNQALGMDVCPRISMLCYPVSEEAFATGWLLVQRSPNACLYKIEKPVGCEVLTRTVDPLMSECSSVFDRS